MCLKGIIEGCLPSISSSSRTRRSFSSAAEVAQFQLVSIVRIMDNFQQMLALGYGNAAWLDLNCIDNSWEDAFNRAQQSESEEGNLISTQEYNNLMLIPNRCVNQTQTHDRILYYNRTIYFYSLNRNDSSNLVNSFLPFMNISEFNWRIKQYAKDLNYIYSLGYSNLIEAEFSIYENYQKVYENSPIGVCAVVTIRILQRFTITRQGFNAELTIDNSGGDTLYNIQVNLNVYTENQIDATYRFSIGHPQISGDLQDTNLPASSSGQINWLLIPYSSAATTQATWYKVGGQLSYTVDGELVNITLQPDSIFVEPEAHLDIAYFLEQNVIGPDPFSNEYISPQPFILAVLITNNGYGSARNFRISSGQPTIVDNKKGLAISFRIIEMKINKEQKSQIDLSATLGDLQPFSTSIITWIMISSLKGYFRKFNASYTETNLNGDPKLSLINSLTTHRLQHVVFLDILLSELNDSQNDYLVNEFDGSENVYSSTNATLYFPVIIVSSSVQYYSIDMFRQRLIINIIYNGTLNSSFIHLSFENSYPQYSIISSKRINNNVDITVNTWLTHNVDHLQLGDQVEDLIHIFDLISSGSNISYEIILKSVDMSSSSLPMSSSTSSNPTNITFLSTLSTILTSPQMTTLIFDNTTTTSTLPNVISTDQTQVIMMTNQQSSTGIFSNSNSTEMMTSITSTTTHTPAHEISVSENVFTSQTSSTQQSTLISSYITLWENQSTSHQHLSSVSISTTLTSIIRINIYIRFKLTFSVNDNTLTVSQLNSQLLSIFTSSLDISSNQINITVTMLSLRILTNAAADVRLFDSITETADSLLARIRQQLNDPYSSLRRHNLISQLNNESISDVKKIYICEGSSIEQETPCVTTTTTQSSSTRSLTIILVVTIIPCIAGVILMGTIIILLIRYFRQRSKSSRSYKPEMDETTKKSYRYHPISSGR